MSKEKIKGQELLAKTQVQEIIEKAYLVRSWEYPLQRRSLNVIVPKNAFSIALEVGFQAARTRYKSEDKSESKVEITMATRIVMWYLIDSTNPNYFLGEYEFWLNILKLKKILFNPILLKEYFKDQILQDSKNMNEEVFIKKWPINTGRSGLYKSKEHFLSDVNWIEVCSISMIACSNSCSEKGIAFCRLQKQLLKHIDRKDACKEISEKESNDLNKAFDSWNKLGPSEN